MSKLLLCGITRAWKLRINCQECMASEHRFLKGICFLLKELALKFHRLDAGIKPLEIVKVGVVGGGTMGGGIAMNLQMLGYLQF